MTWQLPELRTLAMKNSDNSDNYENTSENTSEDTKAMNTSEDTKAKSKGIVHKFDLNSLIL